MLAAGFSFLQHCRLKKTKEKKKNKYGRRRRPLFLCVCAELLTELQFCFAALLIESSVRLQTLCQDEEVAESFCEDCVAGCVIRVCACRITFWAGEGKAVLPSTPAHASQPLEETQQRARPRAPTNCSTTNLYACAYVVPASEPVKPGRVGLSSSASLFGMYVLLSQ